MELKQLATVCELNAEQIELVKLMQLDNYGYDVEVSFAFNYGRVFGTSTSSSKSMPVEFGEYSAGVGVFEGPLDDCLATVSIS